MKALIVVWLEIVLLIATALVSWWLVPLLVPLIAARQYALAVLLHEAQHRILVKNRAANDWVGQHLLAAPLLSDLTRSRASHLAHHRYLGNPKLDPDYPLYSEHRRRRDIPGITIEAYGAQIVVAVALSFGIALWAYPVLWLLPLFLAAVLDRLRIRAEHWPDGTVVSHRSNPVERFFLAPFNMNRHAEHHAQPHVPWRRLPRPAVYRASYWRTLTQ